MPKQFQKGDLGRDLIFLPFWKRFLPIFFAADSPVKINLGDSLSDLLHNLCSTLFGFAACDSLCEFMFRSVFDRKLLVVGCIHPVDEFPNELHFQIFYELWPPGYNIWHSFLGLNLIESHEWIVAWDIEDNRNLELKSLDRWDRSSEMNFGDTQDT